ncbi:MAG: VOC family protein [Verrucomicrobiales bacterium]|jgi:catechol 2,3-dioxygenase-like lactoylglutathione lyase family enzyme|nr:VOC family protein [Verrucomicrobiales bacterium]
MSIRIKEIAFTAYPVTDVARARAFYGQTLGLKESLAHDFGDGMWWIEYDLDAGTFAITNYTKPSADRNGPNIAFEVENLDDALVDLKTKGVQIIECRPGVTIMDCSPCRFFFIADPDGNGINIHQRK